MCTQASLNVYRFFFLGKGVPETIMNNSNRLVPIPNNVLPDGVQAMVLYNQAYNGQITLESIFGIDPLAQSDTLKRQRHAEHQLLNKSIEDIFGDVVNNNPLSLQQAVISFIDLTNRFALQLP